MSKLDTLVANRDKAKDELDAYKDELDGILAGDSAEGIEPRAWTPDEETKLDELEKRYTQVSKRADEAGAEAREATEQQEQRERQLGHTGTGDNAIEGLTFEGTAAIRVGNEPLTYSEAHPENSWTRDVFAASTPSPGREAAAARLLRNKTELEGILKFAPASKEGKRIAAYAQEVRRMYGGERRDVSTETGSMGDFGPPLYFLPEYGAYRTYGRTLIDQLKSFPMPETGLAFNVPVVSTPTEALNQTTGTQGAGDNQTVTSRDMTSTYQSGALQTIIDNLLVSQQYLDRVGPGIAGDMIVRDDQQRQVNRSLNTYAWSALFGTSGVGVQLYTDTAFNTYKFNQTVHKAKAAIEKTDGIVAYPTHLITDVDVWETVEGSYDSNNRPYVVPQGVAFNPLAVGDDAATPEGYTGFRFAGMPAFKDQASWVQWNANGSASSGYSSDHTSLIADLSIAAYWLEGAPVIRVLPQPYAATLTVLIQQYVYCAFIAVYPGAMQLVYGTGTADNLLTA